MITKPSTTRHTLIVIFFALLQSLTLTAVIDPALTKPSTSMSAPFSQPTFNFDFSSLTDRKSAQDAMAQTRSNWGNFFVEKPKPVFSE